MTAALSKTSKGHEQVVISFRITEPGAFEGSDINYYGSFHPNSVEYTFGALDACGFEGDDLLDLSGVIRNEVQLNVQTSEYQGHLQTKVAFVNKLGGIAVKNQLNETEARVFAQRMRDTLRARRALSKNSPNPRPVSKGSPHNPPPSLQASPAVDDDNIPF